MPWKLWLKVLLPTIGVLAIGYAAYWFLRPPIQVVSAPAAKEVRMDTGDTFLLVRVPVRVNRLDQKLMMADFSLSYVGGNGKESTPCYGFSLPGALEFTPLQEAYIGAPHAEEVTIRKPSRFVLYFIVTRPTAKEVSLLHKTETVGSFAIEWPPSAQGK